MKMYIEEVFIINFLLDYYILYGTKRLLKKNTSIIRLIFSAVFGATTIVFLFIDIDEALLIFVKTIYSFIMMFIAFGRKDFIKNLLYFYMISIVLGGSLYLIGMDKYYDKLILAALAFIIIKIFVKVYYNYHLYIHDKYKVIITINNKKYYLDGYIDTGNQLYSPINNKPVILVDFNIPISNIIYVPYKTLNYNGLIKCIKPDNISINDHIFIDYLVGFTNNKINISGCNCILHNCMKEAL